MPEKREVDVGMGESRRRVSAEGSSPRSFVWPSHPRCWGLKDDRELPHILESVCVENGLHSL